MERKREAGRGRGKKRGRMCPYGGVCEGYSTHPLVDSSLSLLTFIPDPLQPITPPINPSTPLVHDSIHLHYSTLLCTTLHYSPY